MSTHPIGTCFADIADMGEEWTFCPFCGGTLPQPHAKRDVCKTCGGSGRVTDSVTTAVDCPDCCSPPTAQPTPRRDGETRANHYREMWHRTVREYGELYRHVMDGDFDAAREWCERHTVHLAGEDE